MACAQQFGTGMESGRADMQQAARQELMRMLDRLDARTEVQIEPGDPPKLVCYTAESQSADLLVIGRGSAGGVFGRLRTNAYAIIRQSCCPVVSV
jgi:nucleotide-binding universal stress UspA family protein